MSFCVQDTHNGASGADGIPPRVTMGSLRVGPFCAWCTFRRVVWMHNYCAREPRAKICDSKVERRYTHFNPCTLDRLRGGCIMRVREKMTYFRTRRLLLTVVFRTKKKADVSCTKNSFFPWLFQLLRD